MTVKSSVVFARLAFASIMACLGADAAQANPAEILYVFHARHDGHYPAMGKLVRDSGGNFYGATAHGGAHDAGTVFRLSPDGSEQVLYAFAGGDDGGGVYANVIQDTQGNLYGATADGGAHSGGTVFRLTPEGAKTTLYSFGSVADDGFSPEAGLIMDEAGNPYGTTAYGGKKNYGTIFEITAAGEERVLYSFRGMDGQLPQGPLLRDGQGNLYGTTYYGGAYRRGVVFRLSVKGKLKVLHSFGGGSDGSAPMGDLVQDKDGSLYGTTYTGGGNGCCGTVYKLAPDGAESVLQTFDGSDGGGAVSGVARDSTGALYVSLSFDGSEQCTSGCGAIVKLSPGGEKTLLHAFKGQSDGANPNGLLLDKEGDLYGATSRGGGKDYGTVFVIRAKR